MYTRLWKILLLIILTNCGPTTEPHAQNFIITAEAGGMDRQHTVVVFTFPQPAEPGDYKLSNNQSGDGTLTITPDNTAWFVLDHLEAGSSREYTLSLEERMPFDSQTGVYTDRDGNQIHVLTGSRRIASYYSGPNSPPDGLDEIYRRGGYLHPVYTPEGRVVTNHLNAEMHPHHSGIWSAWTRTRYGNDAPDFWNVHQHTGRVDVEAGSATVYPGNAAGGFQSVHNFVSLSAPDSPETVLREQWSLQAYPGTEEYLMFDLTVIQMLTGNTPLILPEYHYGGVGFRGHKEWDDPGNVLILTSGGEGREGNESRVNWFYIGGESEGGMAGIQMMSDPRNYRHPQPVRIHPEEPFINFAPQQLGEMRISPGSPYIARYRFITTDGEPDQEFMDQRWQDFANPVTVRVTKSPNN